MADIRAPPLTASAAKEAAKGLFSDLKSKIPKNLPSGPSEKMQFAKHARGRDGGQLAAASEASAGQMEMQPVNSAELPGYNSVGDSAYPGQYPPGGGYPEGTGYETGQYVEGQTAACAPPGGGGVPPPEGGPPGAPGLTRGESTWSSSTVGVEDSHDMITQWQAGWNVTNAIQVTGMGV